METAASTLDITTADAMLDAAAGHLNAQHGIVVDVAIWMLDHVSEWQGDGLWTAERYLAWRCGIADHTAKKIVDIATRAAEFPDCVNALRRGEVSLEQVVPMLRHAPGWADRQAAGLIPRLTVRQATKVAKQYPWDNPHGTNVREPKPDAEPVSTGEATGSVASESATTTPVTPDDVCWFGHDDHGRFRLHLETDLETGDLIEKAITNARDSLFRAGQVDVTDADAVLEVCQRSLDTVPSRDRRNRCRTNLHLHTDGTATDDRGRTLPAEIAQHLSCDGLLSPVFYKDGKPVSVGRTQYIVPDRTRRTVTQRDGGCRVPGCNHDRFIEVHHIIHWTDDGPTDTWNLVCLCPHHHRLHHRGRLGIEGNADLEDGVTFTDHNGRRLTDSGATPTPPGQPPPPIRGVYEHPIGERLEFRWLYFNDDPTRPNRIRATT